METKENEFLQIPLDDLETHASNRKDAILREFRRCSTSAHQDDVHDQKWHRPISTVFPILDQLRFYSQKMFLGDLAAGFKIGLVLIVQSIAFSGLAGLPPMMALASAVFPVTVYAIFGGSKHLSVGPEALPCLLLGIAIGEHVKKFGGDAMTVASSMTLMVGIFHLCMSLCKGGFIDNLLTGYLLV